MSITYDKVSRAWDNTDVDVNITDDDGFNGIRDINDELNISNFESDFSGDLSSFENVVGSPKVDEVVTEEVL